MNNQVMPIESVIQSYDAEFNQVASSNAIKFQQESLYAIQQLRKGEKPNKESYAMSVAKRNPISLKFAIMNVASIGISLSPAKKQAYLVPRDNQIVLDISYMGLCHIAQESGAIKWVQAKTTYSKDSFMLRDIGEPPIHEFDPRKDRGEIDGVYCVAFTGKDYLVEFMKISEVYSIRDCSDGYVKNPKYSPWTKFPEEMIKKTVIKRAAKMWPIVQDSRLFNAIHTLDQHQGIDFEKQEENASEEIISDIRKLLISMGKPEKDFCEYLSKIINGCPQNLQSLSVLTEVQAKYAWEALEDIAEKCKIKIENKEEVKETQGKFNPNDIVF